MLIDVALPVPVRNVFTYSAPESLRSHIGPGVRVRVPFGRRKLIGVVLGPASGSIDSGASIKPVDAVLDPVPVLSLALMDLSRWIASYYQAPLGEALRLALPPASLGQADGRPHPPLGGGGPSGAGSSGDPPGRAEVSSQAPAPSLSESLFDILDSEGERTRPKRRRRIPGTETSVAGEEGDEEPTHVRLAAATHGGPVPLDRRSSRLRAILDGLTRLSASSGWVPLEVLRSDAGASRQDLRRLEAKGWIELATMDHPPALGVETRPVDGVQLQDLPQGRAPLQGPVLTPEQQVAADRIVDAIDRSDPRVFALRGVTGSGKTEVYFSAARRALDRGRSVIFLVPEIGLTPVFVRRVRERFGDQVELVHSRLPARQRQRAWERIRDGSAPLVVGPRSALFAPVHRLGLIVVDEEHDGSYKQEETPRYHARDMALVRAHLEKAPAVLGSATPSVETWHAAENGRYEKLELTHRVEGRPLPAVTIVDMREEYRRKKAPVILSEALIEALRDAKARGEQAVLLLNRRGYAPVAMCRACGEPFGCPHCSVSLVYHRSDETLRCHYCDFRRPRPEACDACGSPHLVYQGEGTERLERHLHRLLPELSVVRLDRDTARTQGAHESILTEFELGHHDVLVGTQMVAKGHDFPGVTVVGVLSADSILGFPDFRASERTFQLLTQVAGRAGRGDRPGCVLVQAYRKDHYALQAAVLHDHESFYRKEITYRRILGYPPFSHLASLTVSGKDLAAAAQRAKDVAARLARNGQERVRVLGPALAPIARLRGLYRFQILLRARGRRRMGDTLRRTLDELGEEKGGTRDVLVDVDPQQLL